MANPEHIEILKSGVEKWNAWRRANLVQVDLSGADLSGANLTEANLSNADLSDANLRIANLSCADLSEAILGGADLSNADLSDANLRIANLSCADLSEAILGGADLSNADLSEADLSDANLCYAILSGADLSDADLSDADLSYAYLTGACLTGADLSGAVFGKTVFSYINLSEAIGLDSLRFHASCSVDHRTLERSGSLPLSFLRGCGFSDEYIQYIPSLFGSGIEFFSCFISYSSGDKEFARRLHDALQGKGIRCWLDEKQILPGDDIHDEIDRGIRLWDKVVLCCSEFSLKKSWWVDDEVEKALTKERNLFEGRGEKTLALIPLNLDGYMFSGEWNSGHKSQLTRRNAADFTEWKDHDKFEAALEGVIKALRADEGARNPPPESKL